jgi:hypothetical protein
MSPRPDRRHRLCLGAVTLIAVITAACSATSPRTARLGPTGDTCLDRGAACTRHRECCTFWCVNGACETRDP